MGKSFVFSVILGGGGLEGAEDVISGCKCELLELVVVGGAVLCGGLDACSLKEGASTFVSSYILESTWLLVLDIFCCIFLAFSQLAPAPRLTINSY